MAGRRSGRPNARTERVGLRRCNRAPRDMPSRRARRFLAAASLWLSRRFGQALTLRRSARGPRAARPREPTPRELSPRYEDSSAQNRTSIYIEDFAGDKGCQIGGEKKNGTRDFFGLGDAAQRDYGSGELQAFLV